MVQRYEVWTLYHAVAEDMGFVTKKAILVLWLFKDFETLFLQQNYSYTQVHELEISLVRFG